MTFAPMSQLRKSANRSWCRKYTYRSVSPTTANCESQYVYDVAKMRTPELWTKLWTVGSISAWRRFSASITRVPFQNASATSRSAAPRTT